MSGAVSCGPCRGKKCEKVNENKESVTARELLEAVLIQSTVSTAQAI